MAVSLGAAGCGERLVDALTARLADLRARTEPLDKRPVVACIEWIDPLMDAGNWVPELVDIAGGTVMTGEPGRHSGYLEMANLFELDPDVIAVMPCGFDVERSLREMPALTSHPGWAGLCAVRAGRVYLTDGNQFFNRPGPRVVESAEILAEILHPDTFDFGHRGTGWIPWDVAPG